MIKRIRIRKITKKIKSSESRLEEIRSFLHEIYHRIYVLLNNMEEMNKENFSRVFRDLNELMGLFKDDYDRYIFVDVLTGIGFSKISIEAYLHGFLKTFLFEQHEKTLVDRLNCYNTQLKLLRKEFFEYKCWNCKNKIKTKELKNYKCELCDHSPMFHIFIYSTLYKRDYETKKLIKQRS